VRINPYIMAGGNAKISVGHIDSKFGISIHQVRHLHRIENVTNPDGEPRIYTVVGYICETDTFGYDRKIAEVRNGDVLAFHNAGAYCSTMASNYNSRVRPAEVMLINGQPQLIKAREEFEDLMHGQIESDAFEPKDESTLEELVMTEG
jgi:diaminopimelate decarboxylase